MTPFDASSAGRSGDPAIPRSAAIRQPEELLRAGLIAPDALASLTRVAERYAIAITPALSDLIDPADPDDPIARQFVPTAQELIRNPAERDDPIGDFAHMPVTGIVHRYPDRVLLKPLHACPVYCRFCFRREMVGPGGEALSPAEMAAALDYIRRTETIFEVIVTGGDPLMMAPRRIAEIVRALSAMPHIGVIRLHSRVPIADPERIGAELLAALDTPKGLFVAIHANHVREFGSAQEAAVRRLAKAGIALLGQSVLLRGINDDADVLTALFRRMIALRIRPYSLHHPDLAPGTSHFRLPLAAGRDLMAGLRGRISGLCQPTYVLDLPGGYGKASVTPSGVEPGSEPGSWRAHDWRGAWHEYRDTE